MTFSVLKLQRNRWLLLTFIYAKLLLLHMWKQHESITSGSYLWWSSSTHSYVHSPHHQIMGYLTLTDKRSSHQHTAGSAFLGSYAIMINSPWICVRSILNSWPSDHRPERRQLFSANYWACLLAIYCPLFQDQCSEWVRGSECSATWFIFTENQWSRRGARRSSLFKPDICWSQAKRRGLCCIFQTYSQTQLW